MPLHTIKKLTLAAITAALAALSAQALVTVNYFTRTSAMAEDRWIKIKVSQTGIQQITGEQLRALGFEHPEHVAVCGYGSSMINNQQISSDVPDDLTPVAAVWDGEKLMFYGEADFSASARLVTSNRAWSAVNSRNYYTAHGCYFLTTRYSPVRPRTVKLADRTPANWLDTSASQVHIEQENIMPEVGARFFHSDFVAEPKQTFDVFMPGYRQSTSDDTRNYSGRTGLNITLAAGVGSERSGTGRWYFEGENSSTYKYINHFTAICNSLSKGYINEGIMLDALNAMLSIHEPRFQAMTDSLTDHQLSLLKAALDGVVRFSSTDVIEKYALNSSANVRRVKDALKKKEIITFNEKDEPVVLDPLFEYWVRKYYFKIS